LNPAGGRGSKKFAAKQLKQPSNALCFLPSTTTKGGIPAMKNPLESLPNTVLMGVILTVIMVAVLAAIE
tara:strand:+ start:71 stop:277 length:207 start_codon:yes stop_codon:yes gene_type:complete